ncbi:hypothetical protein BVRB_6g153170 isoform A [Beta vulgaris subsp. vulgaris]|nr:hypothetical protein BVRB_6g153170 isoform A [Beta vulgaris subsp. vulgaris]
MDKSSISLTKPLRCIVKLGGAAITCKNELEKINEENLRMVSIHLRQAMMSGEVVDMDWSKRAGESEICVNVEEIVDHSMLDSSNFVVGGLDQPLVKAGFVATRISVTSLNLEIVRALAQEGIPSVGISPFSCGWTTFQRNVASADIATVAKSIDSGFIPVLHGDAVFDHSQGCTILSGDVMIRHLAEHLKPEYVVFLTDVFGVYDRPPSEPGAILLREIAVDEEGSWRVVKPAPKTMNEKVEITVAAHDTTGGMVTKISEAAAIAKLGIDVFIVKAATDHSLKALKGELKGNVPDDWLGTAIRFMRK